MRVAIWLALLGYLAGELGRLAWRAGHVLPWQKCRWASTVGCAFYILHVALAFDAVHHWSHSRAYQFTATQTEEAFGLYWGGGLFVNYLFTAIWLTELAAWWLATSQYQQRRRWIDTLVRAFFAFLILNGAVVFVVGPVRWLGIGLVVALGFGFYRYRP